MVGRGQGLHRAASCAGRWAATLGGREASLSNGHQEPGRLVNPFDHRQLTEALAELAGVLFTQRSLKEDLVRLIRLACTTIPACSGASVSMLIEGQPSTSAATDRVAFELDLVQYDHDEGPCVAALGGQIIRVGFVANDDRWPHFAVGAADRRVQSVLSVPVHDGDAVVASLNVYSREPDAFDEAAENLGRVFAAEIAAALVKSTLYSEARSTADRLQEQHQEASQVAMAQGVLMALHEVSADQAIALIRGAADANSERLIEAARRILDAARSDEFSRDI
jgi:GAF domain-containing protein